MSWPSKSIEFGLFPPRLMVSNCSSIHEILAIKASCEWFTCQKSCSFVPAEYEFTTKGIHLGHQGCTQEGGGVQKILYAAPAMDYIA